MVEASLNQVVLIERLRSLLRPIGESDAGAAVSVLLKFEGHDLKLLLVKRAENPSDPWSGDMAFPGGKRHAKDRDLRETVSRETLEEIGIELCDCRFLGTLDIATSNVAPTLGVLPFVFFCEEPPEIKLSEELVSYIWVSIRQLRRSKGVALVHKGTVSAFKIDGGVVWGLTYRMLENLLPILDKAAVETSS